MSCATSKASVSLYTMTQVVIGVHRSTRDRRRQRCMVVVSLSHVARRSFPTSSDSASPVHRALNLAAWLCSPWPSFCAPTVRDLRSPMQASMNLKDWTLLVPVRGTCAACPPITQHCITHACIGERKPHPLTFESLGVWLCLIHGFMIEHSHKLRLDLT